MLARVLNTAIFFSIVGFMILSVLCINDLVSDSYPVFNREILFNSTSFFAALGIVALMARTRFTAHEDES